MRKAVLIITLIVAFAGLLFGITYLTNPEMFVEKQERNDSDYKSQIRLIEYPVQKGMIIHTYEIDAEAVSGSPDVYIKEITLSGITDTNFSIKKDKGDMIEPDETFYSFKGTEYSVGFNGLVLDVMYVKTDKEKSVTIRLLNYDSVYIVANIEIDKIKEITYNTPVKIIYDGQEYNGKINTIGYEVTDRKLPLTIDSLARVYPGTPVKVIFTIGVQNAGIFVPEEAIYQESGDYFANVESENGINQVRLTIGQRFSVEEDGFVFKYVEILSGVGENDTLIVEQVDTAGLQIKDNLINE